MVKYPRATTREEIHCQPWIWGIRGQTGCQKPTDGGASQALCPWVDTLPLLLYDLAGRNSSLLILWTPGGSPRWPYTVRNQWTEGTRASRMQVWSPYWCVWQGHWLKAAWGRCGWAGEEVGRAERVEVGGGAMAQIPRWVQRPLESKQDFSCSGIGVW